jgi:hypothetical protein
MGTPVVGKWRCYIGPGIYEHFKSTKKNRKLYHVLGLSKECNKGQVVVVYRPMYMTADRWGGFIHRSLVEFNQKVKYRGTIIPRFFHLSPLPID